MQTTWLPMCPVFSLACPPCCKVLGAKFLPRTTADKPMERLGHMGSEGVCMAGDMYHNKEGTALQWHKALRRAAAWFIPSKEYQAQWRKDTENFACACASERLHEEDYSIRVAERATSLLRRPHHALTECSTSAKHAFAPRWQQAQWHFFRGVERPCRPALHAHAPHRK